MNGTIRAHAVRALVLLAVAGGCASSVTASSQPKSDRKDQLAFGVEMARRGLWSEALFRFEKVHRAAPDDVRALNNLAVSYEAVGRFEDALAAYRQAVAASPDNRPLKQNYSRFLEFYQAFKPKKPAAAAAPAAPAPEPPPVEPPPAEPPPAEPPPAPAPGGGGA